jgi:hypothetical protein
MVSFAEYAQSWSPPDRFLSFCANGRLAAHSRPEIAAKRAAICHRSRTTYPSVAAGKSSALLHRRKP